MVARDRYGIKPLYYADDGRTFRFASQVKALAAGGAISQEIDPAGLTGFLLWGSVPEPFTILQAVKELRAGYTLTISSEGTRPPRRYWNIAQAISDSFTTAADIAAGNEAHVVREALLDSVRAHLVADVPVGAFLSAGLDSATVVGLAQEIVDNPIQTVTLAFEECRGKLDDEAPIAAEIALTLGAAHQTMMLSMAEMEADLAAFFDAMDQPTVDGINTWFVSRAIAQAGIKVALSGLGGDELLGGYPSFVEVPKRVAHYRFAQGMPFLGAFYRKFYDAASRVVPQLVPKNAGLLSMGGDYMGAYQIQRGHFMPWDLPHIIDADVARTGLRQLTEAEQNEADTLRPQLSGFAKLVELESTRYMGNQLLRDTDWVGMAHSLEIRVPLVDHILLERVVGLAIAGRLGMKKSALPATLRVPLPQSALTRPKTGFTVPIWKWLRKSPELDAWKRVKLLRHPQRRDYSRWAYAVLARMPALREVLASQ